MLHNHLRLRHLRCFLEVSRLGSLTAAAEALHVSQPAASKTIRELEQILGVTLFDRSGRRLVLTAAGRLYQTHAGQALAELERAQTIVTAAPRDRIRIHVGVLPTAGELLPRAALTFRAAHPEPLLDVMTGPNWLLLSLLREGQLDLVVGRMPPPGSTEGLAFAPLYWERIVPVVRPGHPLLQGDWDYGALARYPLMLPPPGALIAGSVRNWLHSVGLAAPEPAYANVSLPFGLGITSQTDTVWFISEGVVAPEIRAGRLVVLPIRNELLGGPVGITRRQGAETPPELAALIAALTTCAAG